MELTVKSKYTQTDIGLIPENWNVVRFGELCTPSKARFNPRTQHESYKCIELEHLSQGTSKLLGYADSTQLLSQKTVFAEGDVLMGKLRPYLRKFLYAPFDGVCTTEIWALKVHKNVDSAFVFHLAQTDKIVEAANQSTGSKMPRAEWKTVAQTLVALPPIEEQTAIATALSDADALIAGLEKLIEKKRLIKQGAMQELLRPKEGWEVKKLGELFEITSSKRVFQKDWKTEGVPFYRARELAVLGEQGWVDNVLFIDREMYIRYKQLHGVPQIGDMLVTGVGTLGKVYEITDDHEFYFKDGNIIWFKINGSLVTSYLKQLYLTPLIIEQIENASAGTTVGTYTITGAKNTVIPLPKRDEQLYIGNVLTDMDVEISKLEHKLAKQKEIKQGMMQVLLTGKVRLV